MNKQNPNADLMNRGTLGKAGFLHTNFGDIPICVNGKRSEHGLGMHTPYGCGGCTVRYALAKRAQVFKSIGALNDLSGHQPITFHVVGGLRETRRLEIGRKCTWLSTSAEGLLATIADAQELWIIDENELRVKDRLHVPSASRIVSAAPLSVAFSVVPANDFMGCPRLLVLDLKTGEQVDGPSPTYQEQGERPSLDGALVTADGKYLFTHDKQLIRFKIDGTKVALDQGSFGLGSGHVESLALSPDSKYVCLPIGGGNPGILPDHPPLVGATFVYPVTDLRGRLSRWSTARLSLPSTGPGNPFTAGMAIS